MDLKLHIYNELDDVVKTYTRNTYSIRMRQLKAIIETLNIDGMASILEENTKNIDLVKYVSKLMTSAYDEIQELIKDIFPELTDEEYMDTHLEEVVKVLVDLVKHTVKTIGLADKKSKN